MKYWTAIYVVLMALVTFGLFIARNRIIQTFGTQQAQAQWQTWRDEAQRQSQAGAGPVLRPPRQVTEPPALVLMREYFGVCLSFSLLITSAVFWTLALMLRGAWLAHHDDASNSSIDP